MNIKHQSDLGFGTASGGVGQMVFPIPLPKRGKEGLCYETKTGRLSQVAHWLLVVCCTQKGALRLMKGRVLLRYPHKSQPGLLSRQQGPSGAKAEWAPGEYGLEHANKESRRKAAAMHPLRSKDNEERQTQHSSLQLTPLRQNICSLGIKSLPCSKQIQLPLKQQAELLHLLAP